MTKPTARPLRLWAAAASPILLTLAGAPLQAMAQDLPDLTDPAPRSAPPNAAAPPEVRAFVKRLAGCNRWAGEEATDAERGATIAQARFRLRCNTIEQDEGRLRARFAKSPSALEALDQAGSADE